MWLNFKTNLVLTQTLRLLKDCAILQKREGGPSLPLLQIEGNGGLKKSSDFSFVLTHGHRIEPPFF